MRSLSCPVPTRLVFHATVCFQKDKNTECVLAHWVAHPHNNTICFAILNLRSAFAQSWNRMKVSWSVLLHLYKSFFKKSYEILDQTFWKFGSTFFCSRRTRKTGLEFQPKPGKGRKTALYFQRLLILDQFWMFQFIFFQKREPSPSRVLPETCFLSFLATWDAPTKF